MHTMSDVLDRFLVEIVPTLARTQSDYQGYIERLRPSFGLTPPNEVTAPDIFEFRAALAKESGNVQANRHISCLSAVFREAIGWRQALGSHPVATNQTPAMSSNVCRSRHARATCGTVSFWRSTASRVQL